MLNCEEVEQSFASTHREIADYALRHSLVENADELEHEFVGHEWVKRTGSP